MGLGDILGLGASAATGGLFGLLGFGFKALFGWLADREKAKLVAQQNAHEIALIREQRQSRQIETENEREIAAEETRLMTVASVIVFQQIFGVSDASTKKEAVGLVLMLTATAVTWWFGDRPRQAR